MIYYNQRNYGNILYPSATYPEATLASSGCGVCCVSMVVENLLDTSFSPLASAKFSMQNGARALSGTDMSKLSKLICGAFPLKCEAVTDINLVKNKLKHGAMAIAHTKGGSQGLFSTSGHFVVLAEFKNEKFTVLDPYLYNGKFNTNTRKGKVTQRGNYLYVSPSNVSADCKKYYIFERVDLNMTVDEAKKIIKETAKLADNTIQYLYSYRYGDDLVIKLAEAMK